MSKHSKTLQSILNPATRTARYTDVKALMEHAGFELRHGSGSGVKFYHPEHKLYLLFHSPHPSPEIKGGALVAVREFCKKYEELLK